MSDSTELVVKNSNAVELSVTADVVKTWLANTESGNNLFAPVLKAAEVNELHFAQKSSTFDSVSIIAAVPTIMSSMSGIGLAYTHNIGLVCLGFLLGPVVGAVSWPFVRGKKKRAVIQWKYVKSVHTVGLRSWLHARYGITVSDGMISDVLDLMAVDSSVSFGDATGQGWMLKADASGSEPVWYVERDAAELAKTVAAEPKVVEAAVVERESLLVGEAAVLYERIQSQVNMLRSYSLEAESSHNVLRVLEDARQAVATYEKWRFLNVDGAGDEKLIHVLTILDGELSALVASEARSLEGSLDTQSAYLESRQLDVGLASPLRLGKSVSSERQQVES